MPITPLHLVPKRRSLRARGHDSRGSAGLLTPRLDLDGNIGLGTRWSGVIGIHPLRKIFREGVNSPAQAGKSSHWEVALFLPASDCPFVAPEVGSDLLP